MRLLETARKLIAPEPTVFHVTHWKAGSQWVYQILLQLAEQRPSLTVVQPTSSMEQVLAQPIIPGALYPTIYLTAKDFAAVTLPRGSIKLVVIRDLRDTLVSAYFSLRYSHMLMDNVLPLRKRLDELSLEDGLLFLLDDWLPDCAAIQQSWLDAGEDVIRYEDLLADDTQLLRKALFRPLRRFSKRNLDTVVARNRFASVTGREPGVEDIQSHQRKGVAGDWRNYLTPKVNRTLNRRYAPLLERAGYQPADL